MKRTAMDCITASRAGIFPAAETPASPPARNRRGRNDAGFSPSVKLSVRTRAGGGDPAQARCEATGVWLGRHGGEIQHRVARGMGGTSDPVKNSLVNAVLLSKDAHRLAESRDRGMNEEGFWLRNGQDPALTPILLHSAHGSGVTVWLAGDGIGDDGNGYLFASPLSLLAASVAAITRQDAAELLGSLGEIR
jgi:5-methylcytosine-specific restriction protein A